MSLEIFVEGINEHKI